MKHRLLPLFLLITLQIQAQDFNQSPYQNYGIASPLLGDFDGDYKADVCGIQFFTDPNRMVLQVNNNGVPLAFTEKDLGLFQDVNGQPDAADMDGDNDLDIVIAANAGLNLFIMKNDGAANFTPDSLGVSGSSILKIGDVDHDNDLDIAGIDPANNTLNLYLNDGSQHFTHTILFSGPDNLEEFAMGDMDNDNDLDMVVGYRQFSGKQIAVFKNNGNNGFSEVIVASNEFSSIENLLVTDINSDGKQDIIVTRSFQCDAYVNQGGMLFTRKGLIDGNNPVRSVSTADYNGDGRTDLAIGTNSGDITWHKNLSNATLEFGTATVGGVSPAFSLQSGDLDNDGDVDLVVSNGEFWWYENVIPQESGTLNFSDKIIRIFPNPFTDFIQIENAEADTFLLNLVDGLGRNVYSARIVSNLIDLSGLNPGTYFLSLSNTRTRQTRSISILKGE